LDIDLLDGYLPDLSDTFVILTYTGTLSGSFDPSFNDYINADEHWGIVYDTSYNEVLLDVWPGPGAPEPGTLPMLAASLALAFAIRAKRRFGRR
jgi:hypothetical protein